jgi:hypothetical protein
MSDHTFKHSGDLGDIVYSLPAVKALGGGTLYLDIDGGREDPFVVDQSINGYTRFNLTGYNLIRPLLMEQPYIRDVRIWKKEPVEFNLDSTRALNVDRKANLAALYMRRFGLDEEFVHTPWLELTSPPIKLHKNVILNRTPRYHCKYTLWELNKEAWLPMCIFIGPPIEHEMFESTFNYKVDYHPTKDALEIAQVLKGAMQLLGNQSLVMAIAIGLGVSYLQEVYDFSPNCIFKRENAQYI